MWGGKEEVEWDSSFGYSKDLMEFKPQVRSASRISVASAIRAVIVTELSYFPLDTSLTVVTSHPINLESPSEKQ